MFDLGAVREHMEVALKYARAELRRNGVPISRNKTSLLLLVKQYLRDVFPCADFNEVSIRALDEYIEQEKRTDPSLRVTWPGCNVPVDYDSIVDQSRPEVSMPSVPDWVQELFQRQLLLLESLQTQSRDIIEGLGAINTGLSLHLTHQIHAREQFAELLSEVKLVGQRLIEIEDWVLNLIDLLTGSKPAGVLQESNQLENSPAKPVVLSSNSAVAPSREYLTVGSRPAPFSQPPIPPNSVEEEEDEGVNTDEDEEGEEVDPNEGSLGKPITAEMLEWQSIAHRVLKAKKLTLAVVSGRSLKYQKAMERIKQQTGFDHVLPVFLDGARHSPRYDLVLKKYLRRDQCQVAVIVTYGMEPELANRAANVCKANGVRYVQVAKPGQTQAVVAQLLQMFCKERAKA